MRTGNGELPGNAIGLPCYLWPADLGFRAALTKLIEDRVRVSEHIAMRPGPDTFSIEVLSLSRNNGRMSRLNPGHNPPARDRRAAAGPMLAGPCSLRAGELRCHSGPGQPPGRALES